MKKLFLLTLMAMLTLLPSCSSDDDNNVTPPEVKELQCNVNGMLPLSFNAFDSWELKSDASWCLLSADSVNFSQSVSGVAGSVDIIIKVADNVPDGDCAELTLSMGGDSFVIVRVYAVNKSAVFAGSMDVLATGSTTPFLCENVECKVALNASASALDLYISGAKFAPQMPTTINIQLQALPCAVTDGGVSFFSNDSIVPLVQMFQDYLPMPEFMFSMIEGSVADGKLNFNAKMTRGTFKYEGDIITE